MKKIILLAIFQAGLLAVRAQLVFHFVPGVYARTIDGLSAFQVQNLTTTRYDGQVSIVVTENTSNQRVVTITTPSTGFASGMTSFPASLYRNSSFSFAQTSIGAIVSQTRQFPTGSYSFCFRFVPADHAVSDIENCFDADVQPLVPITLLSPSDLDTICQKRPLLVWQPPMPYHSSMRFRLVLTEKKAGETAMESIVKNAPLLLLDQISGTSINYPSNYPELIEGKTYCWQVAASQLGLIISTSEVWQFTVQCKEPEKPMPYDSYRELKVMMSGNYYIANRYLKFAFQNNYNVTKLNYSIHDPANKGAAIKRIPEVSIKPGLNKIDIDLSELGLEQGHQYTLRVNPFNEQAIEIKFIYKDEE